MTKVFAEQPLVSPGQCIAVILQSFQFFFFLIVKAFFQSCRDISLNQPLGPISLYSQSLPECCLSTLCKFYQRGIETSSQKSSSVKCLTKIFFFFFSIIHRTGDTQKKYYWIFGFGATLSTLLEIQCLPYAGC